MRTLHLHRAEEHHHNQTYGLWMAVRRWRRGEKFIIPLVRRMEGACSLLFQSFKPKAWMYALLFQKQQTQSRCITAAFDLCVERATVRPESLFAARLVLELLNCYYYYYYYQSLLLFKLNNCHYLKCNKDIDESEMFQAFRGILSPLFHDCPVGNSLSAAQRNQIGLFSLNKYQMRSQKHLLKRWHTSFRFLDFVFHPLLWMQMFCA